MEDMVEGCWAHLRIGSDGTEGLQATAPQLLTSAINLHMEFVVSNRNASNFTLLALSLITVAPSL